MQTVNQSTRNNTNKIKEEHQKEKKNIIKKRQIEKAPPQKNIPSAAMSLSLIRCDQIQNMVSDYVIQKNK